MADLFRGVRAVSFDVDGTLYRDRWLFASVAVESARRAVGGNPIGAVRELARLGRFRRTVEAVRVAGGRLDGSWEAGITERLEQEERVLAPAIRRLGPAPGVIALLDQLRPRVGWLLAVSDFCAEARITALGLDGRFDRVYAAERVGAFKPDPRVFRAALADLGIPAGALLHIGNRPETDGRAARAAGCRPLLLGKDFASFPQLLDAVSPAPSGAGRTPGT